VPPCFYSVTRGASTRILTQTAPAADKSAKDDRPHPMFVGIHREWEDILNRAVPKALK